MCDNEGYTIVIIKLKNSNKLIGGYNPIKWSSSSKFLSTDKSFIFSFYSNTLDSSTIILSRVIKIAHAIADDVADNSGFGDGDLYIFRKSCELADYSGKIHDSENFEIDDYEVFQVVRR